MIATPSRADAADIDRAQTVSITGIAIVRGFAFDRSGNQALADNNTNTVYARPVLPAHVRF